MKPFTKESWKAYKAYLANSPYRMMAGACRPRFEDYMDFCFNDDNVIEDYKTNHYIKCYHPSLKVYKGVMPRRAIFNGSNELDESNQDGCYYEDIQKHTRDVAKIREASIKIKKKYYRKALDSEVVINELLKELNIRGE